MGPPTETGADHVLQCVSQSVSIHVGNEHADDPGDCALNLHSAKCLQDTGQLGCADCGGSQETVCCGRVTFTSGSDSRDLPAG